MVHPLPPTHEPTPCQTLLPETDAHQRMLQAMLDNAPIGIWLLGVDGRMKFINKVFCDSVGVSEQQFLSCQHYFEALPSLIADNCTKSDRECFAQDAPHISMEWLPFVDGQNHLLEITKVKLLDQDGETLGLIGLAADVTERKRAEDRQHLISKVFENTLEGITITDAYGNVIEANPAFCKITGYSHAELVGKNMRIFQTGHHDSDFYESMWEAIVKMGYWKGEVWNRRKNGEIYAEWLSISAINNDSGQVSNYIGISSDITQIKQHEKQLEKIAHYDVLTGLPNRTLLNDRLKQAVARADREKNMMAVCYLDLDGFKVINDTLGHEAGDLVLIEMARRIENGIRGGETVARLGGDEFVILLLGLGRGDECNMALDRLLTIIAEPIEILDKIFVVGASIGVSIYPLDFEDTDTLLRHADQAMYAAKQSGKNRFHIYDPALDQRIRNQQAQFKSIELGLENNQFELYYQPKVDMRTQQLVGAEALIRWNHPELGLLAPARFLPAIENTELDIVLGEWVTHNALQQLSLWRAEGLDVEVSINISAFHLESPRFVESLQQQLVLHSDVPADLLQIEVLETVALEDITQVQLIIERCTKLGVGFALDDFGTGYSSLSYLSSLPVNTLKIDKSFVRNLALSKGDHAIIMGIIALSRAFELKTVAEGIETAAHFDTLLKMNCDIAQGFFIARPMPAAALFDWAQQNVVDYGVRPLVADPGSFI
ncbi:MAG: EAL domain-containing protein [Gallionella sp.]